MSAEVTTTPTCRSSPPAYPHSLGINPHRHHHHSARRAYVRLRRSSVTAVAATLSPPSSLPWWRCFLLPSVMAAWLAPIPARARRYTYVAQEVQSGRLATSPAGAMVMDYILNPLICTVWCAGQADPEIAPGRPGMGFGRSSSPSFFTFLNIRRRSRPQRASIR